MDAHHEAMSESVMKAVNDRYEWLLKHYLSRGVGKPEAKRMAANLATLDRSGRRAVLGQRGEKYGLPRTMSVPKGKR